MIFNGSSSKSGGVVPSGTIELTENGIHDVTDYASAEVNVSGGGSSSNDVIFYDYDGTVVNTYSADEFLALSAMPANPTHEGLTAQGWNWSLAEAQEYVADYGRLNIGQMYITDDGKTRLYIYVGSDSKTVNFSFGLFDGEAVVDWGDNTTETYYSEFAERSVIAAEHTYLANTDYVISIQVVRGSLDFSDESFESFESLNRLRKVELNDVTVFNDGAFEPCGFTSITIPSGITEIPSGAFINCHKLTDITIPDSVTSIGANAFTECRNLTDITIPDSVTSMGNGVFADCFNLTDITIPDSVTSIGEEAFYNCYNLTDITIPDSVTSIGANAFTECRNLTDITIPDSVTSMGNGVFTECHNLTDITIPDSVTSIGANAFADCFNLTDITIPDSVTSIGEDAFFNCYNLTDITIPDSVTSIGEGAFENCGCERYHFKSETPPTLGERALNTYIYVITVPYNAVNAYKTAWTDYADKIVGE